MLFNSQQVQRVCHSVPMVLGSFVFLIGISALMGWMFDYPVLKSWFLALPSIPFPMTFAFMFMGLGSVLVFDGLHRMQDKRLQAIKYLSLTVSAFIGLYYLLSSLALAKFNLIEAWVTDYHGIPVPETAALSTILLSLSLMILALKKHSEFAVVYLVNIPAMLIIQLAAYALAGLYVGIPALFNFKMALPGVLCFLFTCLSIFIGTIPVQGLYLPFMARNVKGRWFAFAAVIFDIMLLLACVNVIVEIHHVINGKGSLQHLYVSFEFLAALVSMSVSTILLRAVHYFNRSLAQEARLNWLYESNIVGILYSDFDGNIHDANDGFLEMIGYSRQELMAKGAKFSRMPEQDFMPRDQFEKRIREQGGLKAYERSFQHKNGTPVYVLMTVAYLEGSGDKCISFIHDISEKKRSEQELVAYQKRLEQSNKELEQFATIASHDLQEPLRKVQVFSQMIAEKSGPDTQDYIKRMQNAVTRMQALIDDLLALSRISRKGRPFKKTALQNALQNALDNLEVLIKESNAQVKADMDGAVIEVDQKQIEQLFQNLIGNAIKFHKDGQQPVVRISGQKLNGCYQLRLEDNGIGFEEVHKERIFEPFERLHGKEKFSGTGMGLTICKKIVDRHQGSIEVSSQPDRGTVFMVTLPITQPDV